MAVLCVAIGTSACLFAACGDTGETDNPDNTQQETPDNPGGDDTEGNETQDNHSGNDSNADSNGSFDAREVTEEDVALFKEAVSASLSYDESFTMVYEEYPASYFNVLTISYDDSNGYLVVKMLYLEEYEDEDGNPIPYEDSFYFDYTGDEITVYYVVRYGDQLDQFYVLETGTVKTDDEDWEDAYSAYSFYKEYSIKSMLSSDIDEVSSVDDLMTYMYSLYKTMYGGSEYTDIYSLSVKDEDGTTIFTMSGLQENQRWKYVDEETLIPLDDQVEITVYITDNRVTGINIQVDALEKDGELFYSNKYIISMSYDYDSSLWPSDADFESFNDPNNVYTEDSDYDD